MRIWDWGKQGIRKRKREKIKKERGKKKGKGEEIERQEGKEEGREERTTQINK